MKICRCCKAEFIPVQPMQRACSPRCALRHARIAREKLFRKETRVRRKRLKTLSEHLSDAQTMFNKWIRLRDADLPCVSCQRFHTGQYHCGHFRQRSTSSSLRYSEWNCAKQCQPCNMHLSGNLLRFREGLVARHGLDRVLWLESQNEPTKWTIEEAQHVREFYRLRLKNNQSYT